MITKRDLTTFSIVALFCFDLLYLGAGCATANRTMYKGVEITHATVQEAMLAWNQYVGLRHPPASMELRVKAAFEKWQRSMIVVCDVGAAIAAGSRPSTNNITGVSAALQEAVSNAAQNQADLIDLITSVGVKL